MRTLRAAMLGTTMVAVPLAMGGPVVNALTLGTSWVRVDAVDNGDETVTLRVTNLDRENPITCAAVLTDPGAGPTTQAGFISLRADLAPGQSRSETRGTVPGHYRVAVRCDGEAWRYTVSPGSLFTVSPRSVAA